MLHEYRQFTVRHHKKPVSYLTGSISDGLNPEIWTDYQTASITASVLGEEYGVGFILTDNDPFFLIDLDHCKSGQTLTAIAADLIKRFSGCYIETSQSGNGLHIIGSYGVPIAPHKCKNVAMSVELYHTARMISLTGTDCTGDAGALCDESLGALIREYFGKITTAPEQSWTSAPVPGYACTLNDDELIDRALRSRSNFALLWSGNTACYNNDHSSADQALCNQLIYWTGGNCDRAEKLFERSGLVRDKWLERDDYRQATILTAFAGCQTFYKTGSTTSDGLEWADLNNRQKPLQTFENIDRLITHIGGSCRYNLLKKRSELIFPEIHPLASVPFLRSWCERVGLPHGNLWEMVEGVSLYRPYCPATNYLKSTEWDGTDRLDELAGTLNAENNILAAMLLKRWMIYAAQTVLNPEQAVSPGVLVLQGDQGIGKTTWCRRLASCNRDLFLEGAMLDPRDKDSYIQALNYWIVELGEFARTNVFVDWIKSFSTNQQDYFRMPYGHRAEFNPRRTAFVGTVNADNYLIDSTGNRRFLTIRCGSSIKYDHGLNMGQIWSQIIALIDRGETSILTRLESDMLESLNAEVIQDEPITELLKIHYDVSKPRTRAMTTTEILKEINHSTDKRSLRRAAPLIAKFLKS